MNRGITGFGHSGEQGGGLWAAPFFVPLARINSMRASVADLIDASELPRFWAKVDQSDGCWLWNACTNRDGYGSFRVRTALGLWITVGAHQVLWIAENGMVPDGLELDHVVCQVRACVRPSHLEPVLHAINVGRGRAGERQRARVACPQGHLYADRRHVNGQRVCSECNRQATLIGRRARGVRAKKQTRAFTDEQITEIRRRWLAGEAKKALAREFGVSPRCIYKWTVEVAA